MPQSERADKLTYETRVTAVLALMARGWGAPRIVESVRKSWDLGQAQAYNYIRTAKRRIAKITEHKREHLLGEILSRHDDLRDKGYAGSDHRLVLELDKEDAKLLGLYPPTKIAPTDPTGQHEYAALSDDERAKRVAALLKRAKED